MKEEFTGAASVNTYEYTYKTASIIAGLFALYGESLHRKILDDTVITEEYENSAFFQLGQKIARAVTAAAREPTVKIDFDPIEHFWVVRIVDEARDFEDLIRDHEEFSSEILHAMYRAYGTEGSVG